MVHGQGRRLIRPVVLPTLAVGAPAKTPPTLTANHQAMETQTTVISSIFHFPFLQLGRKTNLHLVVVYYLQTESPQATTQLIPAEHWS